MAEPSTTIASTGAALVTIATLAVGPILGEYSIIIALGLLGTLIALSEENSKTIWSSFIFIFKGIIFSVVFTGIATSIIISYIPKGYGLTPYAILGGVAFFIGWTSNKWGGLRDKILAFLSSKT